MGGGGRGPAGELDDDAVGVADLEGPLPHSSQVSGIVIGTPSAGSRASSLSRPTASTRISPLAWTSRWSPGRTGSPRREHTTLMPMSWRASEANPPGAITSANPECWCRKRLDVATSSPLSDTADAVTFTGSHLCGSGVYAEPTWSRWPAGGEAMETIWSKRRPRSGEPSQIHRKGPGAGEVRRLPDPAGRSGRSRHWAWLSHAQ
jgi:hypothetical protein